MNDEIESGLRIDLIDVRPGSVRIISNERERRLLPVVYLKYSAVLHVGEWISPEIWTEIEKENFTEMALKKAFASLERRSYTREELRIRLKRACFSDDVVEHTLDKIDSLGYLDHESSLLEWGIWKAREKPIGPFKLIQLFHHRGVERELAQQLTDQVFQQIDEKDQIVWYLKKKGKKKSIASPNERLKLMRSLQQQGFHHELICEFLSGD